MPHATLLYWAPIAIGAGLMFVLTLLLSLAAMAFISWWFEG